jgi:hypothetical protein
MVRDNPGTTETGSRRAAGAGVLALGRAEERAKLAQEIAAGKTGRVWVPADDQQHLLEAEGNAN